MTANFLAGIRVCDLTWAGAGPFATKFLSDFGAEVIKVETSTRPDPVRLGGPFKDRVAGTNRSGYFASRNTGKQSIALNMKTDEGRKLLTELIKRSDVISNNFAYGVMDRLGLSYDEVRAIKSDIIYLSMPLYANDGPATRMSGVGMSISAVTGLMYHTGYDEDHIVGPGTHYPDHAANPCHAAFAIIGALRYRRQTGKGMNIDLSQVESTINFAGPAVLETATTGDEPAVNGNGSRQDAPCGIFRAAGDDAWCAIELSGDASWRALADAIGKPGLADRAEFATPAGRLAHAQELETILADWAIVRTPEQICAALEPAGVIAARASSSRHLVTEDPQLNHRAYWQRIEHPELGNSLYAHVPCKIDGERVSLTRPPLFGEHTEQVLTSVLSLSRAEVDKLKASEVLA